MVNLENQNFFKLEISETWKIFSEKFRKSKTWSKKFGKSKI